MGSVVAIWVLLRAALPGVPWIDVATVHLSANAVANSVPAGPAAGGAVALRLLSRAGVDAAQAGTGVSATGMVAAATLAPADAPSAGRTVGS